MEFCTRPRAQVALPGQRGPRAEQLQLSLSPGVKAKRCYHKWL